MATSTIPVTGLLLPSTKALGGKVTTVPSSPVTLPPVVASTVKV